MKFLSSAFALVSCAVVTGGLLAACSTASYVPDQKPTFYRNLSAPGSEVDGQATASMVSGYRANKGLGPVVLDPTLSRIAKEHAVAMARKTKVGHDVGDGPLDKRARAAGYDYARISENVAGGYQTLAEAFSGWRDSPDHNKNMLMPKATRIGIGVAQAPGFKYKVFWSMVVAEPAGAPTPVMPGSSFVGLSQ